MSTTLEAYKEKLEEEQEDESSMSFLDHLDELRSRLIRIALFVFIAFILCWIFSDHIYNFLQVPVRAAMIEARKDVRKEMTGTIVELGSYPDDSEIIFTFPAETKIKNVLVAAGTTIRAKIQHDANGALQLVTVTPWLINKSIVLQEGYVIPPEFYSESSMYLNSDNQLVVSTVQGAFNLYIKVAFYAAIFFGVPFILVQAWGFISPGLYPHEKKYAIPFIVMASVFFMLGCAFAYYIAFPRAANFLLSVAAGGNLRPLVTAEDYFDLILTITLG